MLAQFPREDGHLRVTTSAAGISGLRASVAFEPGAILVAFRIADLVPEPVRYSIQLGVSTHVLVDPEFLRFMNHSCEPTVTLDTNELCVRALQPIEPGDEITFFYPSTEWSMSEPFNCLCGSARCLSSITGAAQLSADVLARYDLADHIRLLLAERNDYSAPQLAVTDSASDQDG